MISLARETKERLAGRGHTQRDNVYFAESSSPIVSVSGVRLSPTKACEMEIDFRQLDIDDALFKAGLE